MNRFSTISLSDSPAMFHGSSPSSFSAEVGFLGRAAREDARPGRRRSVSSVRSRSSSRLSATAEERSPGDSSDEEPARMSVPSSHAPTVRALSPPAPVRIVESTPLLPGKEEEEHLSSAARGELDILLGCKFPTGRVSLIPSRYATDRWDSLS